MLRREYCRLPIKPPDFLFHTERVSTIATTSPAKVKRLKFSKEKCISCELCMMVCSAMHEGEYAPSKARLCIESYYDEGQDLKFSRHICTLCKICQKSCPEEAILVGEKVTVDLNLCTGCGICAEKCPSKVIKIRNDRPVICDTCNGDPWCVKACPHEALRYE